MVRALYRRLWLPIYRRYALQKMQETDRFTLAGITVTIPAGVFHPGLFFSTPIFIEFLKRHEFQGQKTVDIGCGSGLLALYAARRGATVIALDINPLSVAATRQNADANQLTLSVLESDLFAQVPSDTIFDIVLINPPYYPKQPTDMAAHAFFAGPQLEYFQALFFQLPEHIHSTTKTWMILSEDCDIKQIKAIAHEHHFQILSVFERWHWGERLFVGEVLWNADETDLRNADKTNFYSTHHDEKKIRHSRVCSHPFHPRSHFQYPLF